MITAQVRLGVARVDLSSLTATQGRQRVAILIDGDNYPRAGLAAVEAEARKWGDVTVRRVFGDMALHKTWGEEIAYTATHSTTAAGKNRADMAFVVAAMDIAHRGMASVFVIVSDDRDFGPLVNHLREQGHRVEWMGKKKVAPVKPASSIAMASDTVPLNELSARVRAIVSEAGPAGFPIQSLGPALQKNGIQVSRTPQKTWRAWLAHHAADFDCDPKGPQARVRVKT